jgi:hypothetical protein
MSINVVEVEVLGAVAPLSSATPQRTGVAAAGTSRYASRADHVHDTIHVEYALPAVATDVTADLQALINLYSASNRGARIHLSGGRGLLSGGGLTHKQNVHLEGGGQGITTLQSQGAYPCINMLGDFGAGAPLNNAGVSQMTLRGSGKATSGTGGIVANFTNRCSIKDVRVFGADKAVSSANAWQTEVTGLLVDGGGSDQSNYGLFLAEDYHDSLPYDNNAHIVSRLVAQNLVETAVRIENGTGSHFDNCQAMASRLGWWVGDQPGGHSPIQFMAFEGCDGDTCTDGNWVFNKGLSSYLGDIWLSHIWSGLTGPSDSPGSFHIRGARDFQLSGLKAASNACCLHIQDSDLVQVLGFQSRNYDRAGTGTPAILVANSTNCQIIGATGRRTTSNASTRFIVETGTSDSNLYSDINADTADTIIGANSRRHNRRDSVAASWLA